jgi:hypothetical protein
VWQLSMRHAADQDLRVCWLPKVFPVVCCAVAGLWLARERSAYGFPSVAF